MSGDRVSGIGIGAAHPVVELSGLGGELGDRPGEHHSTGGKQGDLAAQGGQIVHPVAGQDHRGALGGQPRDDAVHVAGAGRVEAVGGLVEDEQPGLGEQRGGQAEPLPHAEGEPAQPVIGDVGESDLLERGVEVGRAVAAQPGQRGQVGPRGERRVEARAVHESGDAVGQGELATRWCAEDLERAGIGRREPEDQTEQGRLAGAVRTDQAVHLALGYIEVDAVESDGPTEGLADPARSDRRRSAHLVPLSRNCDKRNLWILCGRSGGVSRTLG